MDKKQINLLWSTSLIVLGIATIILSFSAIVGIDLPDALRRFLGVIELIFLFLLGFTSRKKRM